MPEKILYHALNSGVVDRDKLHRVDLEKMRLAAEDQTNLLCDAVGKAFLRPGTEHFGLSNGGAKARLIEFVAGGQQKYGLELTDNALRVWDYDALVSRPATTAAVTNGDFNSATGWTLGTDAGTTVAVAGGALKLQAQGRGARARAKQQVTSDAGVVTALRITVFRGPVSFRVGSADGGQDLIKETTLRTGYHSLAFVPGASFWIEFSSKSLSPVYVNDVNVEAAGVMVLPTIWEEDDMPFVRYDQSLDVMFLACEGRKQQRIETRGDNSWSVCDYDANDGPFIVGRTADVKLRPSVLEGLGNLYSDIPFFTVDHVGALFRIYHDGQNITTSIAGSNEFTPPIMVTGINEPEYNERDWTYTITGTWAGTLRVQRSFDGEDVEFHDFRKAQGSADVDITANVGPVTNDDNEDNAIAYYRIGFPPGLYTSGQANISMSYNGGGGFGICRVTSFTSATEVIIEVLKPFAGITETDDWREGMWSESNGWPTSMAFHEGRLWQAGYDGVWASVSDAYESYDEDFVGDAGPLLRSIALGGRNEARWLIPLSNLMLGTNGLIASCRGSSLDEIMTPENFGIRRLTRVGAAQVNPVAVSDDRALFVETSGTALYELSYQSDKGKFLATEFSKLTTDVFQSGITGISTQFRPDQRIWITTEDAEAICIVFEPEQQVVAYIPISTSWETDIIESSIVLPGQDGQDRVIMSVKRVVNGVTSRRIERLALDRESIPGDITKCLDAHVTFGAGSATINLPHLIGRTVCVWMDGAPIDGVDGELQEFTVSGGGTITLPSVPTIGGCAGIPYVGRYKSAKLEYGSGSSTSMLANKSLAGVGLLLGDYCRSGVKFGGEFDNADHPLFSLPGLRNGKPILSDVIIGPDETEEVNPTGGEITKDIRMCIEVRKPASILALVMSFQGNE